MTATVGQTWRERYGDEPMQSDAKTDCAHDHAQLTFVHPQMEEWYCYDCQQKVRVWSL